MKQINKPFPVLQFDNLGSQSNITHFITTRHGGDGRDNYATFNLGEYCGDDNETVTRNREILCQAFRISPEKLFVPNQVHESESLYIDNDFLSLPKEDKIAALHGLDALITNIPDVCIAVSTADCVPILIYAPDKQVIAAIHAGWRGSVLQIAWKTVSRLSEHYGCDPAAMIVGLGPSIGMDRFEVGEEVLNSFRMIGSDLEKIAIRNPETQKPHINLNEANRLQLINAGVKPENIETAGICTYSQEEDFFSARRLGIRCGRILSGIQLKS